MNRFFILSVFIFICCAYAKAIEIVGPEIRHVGQETAYHFSFNPTLEMDRRFKFTCSDNACFNIPNVGLTKYFETEVPLTMDLYVCWQSTGNGFVRVEQIGVDNQSAFNVIVKDPFDLEDGYSGDPLIMSISDSNPEQYEFIDIFLREHYIAEPDHVEWNVGGYRFQTKTLNTSIDLRDSGATAITAKIFFRDTNNQARSISRNIVVSPTAPNLAGTTIIGATKLGVGSQASYIINKYSTDVVEYMWSVIPNRNIEILSSFGNSLVVHFLRAGSYSISCKAKNKNTGIIGTSTSVVVTVSDDYGIQRDEELLDVNLENGGILRVNSKDKELLKKSEQVQYKLCNLITGGIVQMGYVNKENDTYIDVSAFRQGLYVLYVQINSKIVRSYKFSLNR